MRNIEREVTRELRGRLEVEYFGRVVQMARHTALRAQRGEIPL